MVLAVSTRSGLWKRLIGLLFLAVVVVAWTASNFLNSSILADDTYSHPFFVVYICTSFFALPLIPLTAWRAIASILRKRNVKASGSASASEYSHLHDSEADGDGDGRDTLGEPEQTPLQPGRQSSAQLPPLTTLETFKMSFKFCFLWMAANYFNTACLQFTTVASTTILASTSSIFTLIIGALAGVERFTTQKLLGVVLSLVGVAMITLMDVYSQDGNRGKFPEKSPAELALGDIMSLTSAFLYGLYITSLAKAVGDESRFNPVLFFGLIGLINIFCAWPLFFILHFLGIETFALPPDWHVWSIILANASISLISDLCWVFAVVLTSPLITTVGLSLTIPLSLVGQFILNDQYSGPLYWVGAALVVLAFVWVNRESKATAEQQAEIAQASQHHSRSEVD